jgi:hypothetical protein
MNEGRQFCADGLVIHVVVGAVAIEREVSAVGTAPGRQKRGERIDEGQAFGLAYRTQAGVETAAQTRSGGEIRDFEAVQGGIPAGNLVRRDIVDRTVAFDPVFVREGGKEGRADAEAVRTGNGIEMIQECPIAPRHRYPKNRIYVRRPQPDPDGAWLLSCLTARRPAPNLLLPVHED